MIYQSHFVAVCDIPILNCPHRLNMNIKKNLVIISCYKFTKQNKYVKILKKKKYCHSNINLNFH